MTGIEATAEPTEYTVRFDVGPDRTYVVDDDHEIAVASIVPPPGAEWDGDAESVRVTVRAVLAFHAAHNYA